MIDNGQKSGEIEMCGTADTVLLSHIFYRITINFETYNIVINCEKSCGTMMPYAAITHFEFDF